MINFKDLINKLDNFDSDTYWFGPTALEQIQALEQKLNLKLPDDFIKFLEICGGGGTDSAEISGIYKNDALREDGGTVLYSTLHSRESYELPPKLAVIFLHDDEICWAINCEEENFGEVVSYNIFTKKVEKTLNKSFSKFFEEYVNLRTTEDWHLYYPTNGTPESNWTGFNIYQEKNRYVALFPQEPMVGAHQDGRRLKGKAFRKHLVGFNYGKLRTSGGRKVDRELLEEELLYRIERAHLDASVITPDGRPTFRDSQCPYPVSPEEKNIVNVELTSSRRRNFKKATEDWNSWVQRLENISIEAMRARKLDASSPLPEQKGIAIKNSTEIFFERHLLNKHGSYFVYSISTLDRGRQWAL